MRSAKISLMLAAAILLATPAHAELSAEELAKLAQNPVGNLISVPFQNNTNFNVGPYNGTQNILDIQPVIPVEVNKDWNIITRTIVPVISQPQLSPTTDRTNGIGDTVFSAFLSPAQPHGLIWGVGPVVQLPTNTSDELGNKNWGLGPTFVALKLEHGNPWVYGVLANNIWSLSSSKQGGLLQQRTDPAVRQLQLPRRLLSGQRSDPDGRLEGRQRAAVDRSLGWRHRQDLPPREAAGEYHAAGLLQRGAPG